MKYSKLIVRIVYLWKKSIIIIEIYSWFHENYWILQIFQLFSPSNSFREMVLIWWTYFKDGIQSVVPNFRAFSNEILWKVSDEWGIRSSEKLHKQLKNNQKKRRRKEENLQQYLPKCPWKPMKWFYTFYIIIRQN